MSNFRIVSFIEDQFDMSACNPETEKYDGDGMRYAIIKVISETPNENPFQYDFNFFNMKHVKTNHNDELWIYVQRNAKNVTVTRPGYIAVSRYALNPTIEAGKNYVMTVSASPKKIYKQSVRFNVTPSNSGAQILVRRRAEGAKEEYFGYIGEDGSVAKNLECGSYDYIVIANGYETAEGILDLNYSGPMPIGPAVTEKINLFHLSSGSKSDTTSYQIGSAPDLAEVTFKVDADADIIVDSEWKGFRSCMEKLVVGQNYIVECRQPDCESTFQTILIDDSTPKNILLKAPVPITGYVSVSSSPLDAAIIIGGKGYGKTPKTFELPIGEYNMSLITPGYKDYNTKVKVTDGETTEVSCALSSMEGDSDDDNDMRKREHSEDKKHKKRDSSGGSEYIYEFYEFYGDLGFKLEPGTSLRIAPGARYRHLNCEFLFSMGLDRNADDGLGFNIGYYFKIGNRIELMPQIGWLAEKQYDLTWLHNLSVGPKFIYKLVESMGIFANLEYVVPFKGMFSNKSENGGFKNGNPHLSLGLEICVGL